MNARTWATICGFVLPLFLVIFLLMVFHPNHPAIASLEKACVFIVVGLGLLGAVFGLRYTFGRLHFGCPFCNTRSRVTTIDKYDMYLECPSCGEICVTVRTLRTPMVRKLKD
jgi:hypothetical protein